VKQRVHAALRGAVQGVGFRPFIFRLATELHLTGWVLNSPQGVSLEAEGETEQLEAFLLRIECEKPALSSIQGFETRHLDPAGYTRFEIRPSEHSGSLTAIVLPDIATCPACVTEITNPADRRYRYPFTNCTNCGPRFTIIESLPYDRANTSMRAFPMCPACATEFEDPVDRRFHAQPNACPICGPWLELWNDQGQAVASRGEALQAAAAAIRSGAIVAMKGLGGFHLIADARSTAAVDRLRSRKHREEKPFALLYPSLGAIGEDCLLSPLEERLLRSAEAPIVLLRRKLGASAVTASVAPKNPYLGVMLPYTPLHHLLMRDLGFPVVATSGNISDEPICTEERESKERLGQIADLFLVHNRPIVRHVDDSVVRIVLGRELVLRRSRGYAPLPLRSAGAADDALAVGAHLKSTAAVSSAGNVFISQHIGDLDNKEAAEAFRKVIHDFRALYRIGPTRIAADLHPDYMSTRFAVRMGPPVLRVQHHHAHVLSCMAENELTGTVLGIAWDGTGFGPDGTVWGGEFLIACETSYQRAAHFQPFRLPGGDQAVREPRRTALALLVETFGPDLGRLRELPCIQAFSPPELRIMLRMIAGGIHSPWTTSAGRLFDAAASISGLRHRVTFEGQAAMELEFSLDAGAPVDPYPFELACVPPKETIVVDWKPLVRGMVDDFSRGVPVGRISRRFHDTLVEIISRIAGQIGQERVVLSGGCFQNRYLTEKSVQRLRAEGFRVYWHQRVPPNDGGISLGQIFALSADRSHEPDEKGVVPSQE
jgi:hydrogenase maturation protein HypF